MMAKLKTAAVVTIRAPGRMHARGRRKIAAWLRKQANLLESHGKDYATAGTFRARWQYS